MVFTGHERYSGNKIKLVTELWSFDQAIAAASTQYRIPLKASKGNLSETSACVCPHVPEILWAELRLQELEELLSSHGIFQDFIDAKSPSLYSLLAWLLTAGQGTKSNKCVCACVCLLPSTKSTSQCIPPSSIALLIYWPSFKLPECGVIWNPGVGRIWWCEEGVIFNVLLCVAQQTVGKQQIYSWRQSPSLVEMYHLL